MCTHPTQFFSLRCSSLPSNTPYQDTFLVLVFGSGFPSENPPEYVGGRFHARVCVEGVRKKDERRVARIRVFRKYRFTCLPCGWIQPAFQATVMLNANVAFLAIQSVDVNSNPYRSPAQISSYLSVVANIGSIILGLLLLRQNRTKSKETADEAVSHFCPTPSFLPIHAKAGLS